MAAKLRNMARVGGERVRELDHFVESVRTPIVELALGGGTSGGDKGGAGGDRLAVRKVLEAESRRLALNDVGGLSRVELGDGASCLAICAVAPPPPFVAAYARLFWTVVLECAAVLGWSKRAADQVRPYYAASVRANEMVCALDDDDGFFYVNVVPFQQANQCEMMPDQSLPSRVSPKAWPEILPYWTQRFAEADKGHAGLFDMKVRHRLADRLLALAGEAPGMENWAFDGGNDPAQTKPHPVDDDDLLIPHVVFN